MSRSSQRDITNRGDRPGTPSSAGSPRDKMSNWEKAAQIEWLRKHQHDGGSSSQIGQSEIGLPVIGKKSPDTLGYVYCEAKDVYNLVEDLTLDAPREGWKPNAGDLIAGSGNSKIYKYMKESSHGKVVMDKNGEIQIDKARGSETYRYASQEELDKEGLPVIRKRAPDTLGYTYDEAQSFYFSDDEREHPTLDDPREGWKPDVGDLIAGSGNYNTHRHLVSSEEKAVIDKKDKMHPEEAKKFKTVFKQYGFGSLIPTTLEDRNKLLDKFEEEDWKETHRFLQLAEHINSKNTYLNREQLQAQATKRMNYVQIAIQGYIDKKTDIDELSRTTRSAERLLERIGSKERQKQDRQGQSSS